MFLPQQNIKSYFVELKNSAYFVNVRTMNTEFFITNTDVHIFDGLKIPGGNTNKAGVIYENNFRPQELPAREVIYLSQEKGSNEYDVFCTMVNCIKLSYLRMAQI